MTTTAELVNLNASINLNGDNTTPAQQERFNEIYEAIMLTGTVTTEEQVEQYVQE
tara:strand:- start:442 stop:606 length:165 start_codon:yes stop_codon:yes gene_type:complete